MVQNPAVELGRCPGVISHPRRVAVAANSIAVTLPRVTVTRMRINREGQAIAGHARRSQINEPPRRAMRPGGGVRRKRRPPGRANDSYGSSVEEPWERTRWHMTLRSE